MFWFVEVEDVVQVEIDGKVYKGRVKYFAPSLSADGTPSFSLTISFAGFYRHIFYPIINLGFWFLCFFVRFDFY